MAKYTLRLQARKLRKIGKSVKWIAKKLKVSSASVSIWCRDILLTPEQMEKIKVRQIVSGYAGRMKGALMNKEKRLKRIKHYQMLGRKEVGTFSKRDLFLLGLGLYAGEGYTYGNKAGIANSDPKIILIVLKWFREICHITEDRFRMEVGINRIHEYRVKEVERYWSELTGVPLTSFIKTSLKNVLNKKVYEDMNSHFGTLTVRILKSSDLEYRILGWLDAALSNK